MQKEHEESVNALKLQLEQQSATRVAPDDEALREQLSQARAEVRLLKEQLQSTELCLKTKKAEYDAESARSTAAAPCRDVHGEIQASVEARDGALAELTSQTHAWNAEKEQLKQKLENMKSDFDSKIAAAAKATPGGPADANMSSILQKVDSALKTSIMKGELRGAAVAQVGKVNCSCVGVLSRNHSLRFLQQPNLTCSARY
jgi:hypothetical protein